MKKRLFFVMLVCLSVILVSACSDTEAVIESGDVPTNGKVIGHVRLPENSDAWTVEVDECKIILITSEYHSYISTTTLYCNNEEDK